MHGIAEKVTGYCLHDVLYELRTIGFDVFPFFSGADAFISYGFAAKSVLANLRFNIAEHSA